MRALRGQKFDQKLFDDTLVVPLPVPERKGRSEALIDERDNLLVAIYAYYKLYHSYLRYEIVIDEKIKPVIGFLAPYTISKKIDQYSSEIRQILNEKPAKNWFKSEYPRIVWD